MRAARLVLVLATLVGSGCRDAVVYDELASRMDRAQQRPGPGAFELIPSGPAIRAASPSRLTFHARVRDRSWLRVGVQPDVVGDDSLAASIGISDGRVFREMTVVSLHREPAAATPLFVDLRQYAGLTVDIIFNVRGGAPGRSAALWIAPALLQR
ncbi:MAG: hypothetical protein IT184_11800 [Acidobacteria bacterium]|nr:hypothetical protein [Acidobacteriota bacterium]